MALYSLLKRREKMEFLTTTEMAKQWNISRRRIATLCRDGRIAGAVLKGRTWLIPEDAEKPDDPRRARKNNQEAIIDEQYGEQ
jgi:DNA (cytosine-5)-methyltransferase 1